MWLITDKLPSGRPTESTVNYWFNLQKNKSYIISWCKMFKIFSSQKHSLNINTRPTVKYYLCSMQYVTCQYFGKSVILEEFQGFHCYMSSILKNLCHILSPFVRNTFLFGSGWHNLINQRTHCQVAWFTLSPEKISCHHSFSTIC